MMESLPLWTDLAVAITAICAIILSIVSLYYARASLALAEVQEFRRAPKLSANFLKGDYTIDAGSGSRIYHIQLAVGNVSDSDNAVARVELRLTYRLKHETEITIRLQPDAVDHGDQMMIPIRIAAHETVAGWCHFVVPTDIITGNSIETYAVELIDTHGHAVAATPLLISERRYVR